MVVAKENSAPHREECEGKSKQKRLAFALVTEEDIIVLNLNEVANFKYLTKSIFDSLIGASI